MDEKLDALLMQMKTIEKYADELLEIRSELLRHKNRLNEAWVAYETEGINDMLDRLNRQARRMSDDLCGIGHDIVKAYEKLEEDSKGM